MFLTLFLPAFYIAVAGFHPEMIPALLMASVIESKRDVPFVTAVEVLAMLAAFEILQEAGLRLPKAIGQAVSIIGGSWWGKAPWKPGSFRPSWSSWWPPRASWGTRCPSGSGRRASHLAVRPGRRGELPGPSGMVLAFAVLLGRLSALESFGVAYLTPFAAARGAADSPLLRPPLMERKTREAALHSRTSAKQK